MTIGQIKQFTTGGVFQCKTDNDLTVVFANANFYSFIGYSQEEFLTLHNSTIKSMACYEDSFEVFEYIKSQLQNGQGFSVELNLMVKNDLPKWILISAEIVENNSGDIYLYCIFSDITLQKSEQAQLKVVQQRYQFILDHIEDVIFEWNYKTKEIYQMTENNSSFNYRSTIRNFPDTLISEGRSLHPDDQEIFLNNYRKYDNGATSAYAEYRIRDKSGIYFWCATNSVGIFENGVLVKVIGKIANINAQKLQLLEMSRKAMRDPLTELYNRKATESLVEQYIESTENMAAMMIIDLDNFKLVNDTLGHLQGDNVLNEVASEITSVFRGTDIVGRIGGDEFVVFMTDIHDEDSVNQAAQNLLAHFKKALEGLSIGGNLSGSIGVSVYPKDAKTYLTLLDKADTALYYAKNTGKNKYILYDDEFSRESSLTFHSVHARIKRTPNESQKREDLYRLVLDKSNIISWIYDIKNKRIQKILTSTRNKKSPISYENFPQDLIDKGYVHPDSVQPLLEIYLRLAMGEKDVSGEICTINPQNKSWDWQLISYTSIFDEDGMPDIAVGTSKNISDKKNAQLKYKQDADIFTVLESGVICASITNLTKNIVERYRHSENQDLTEGVMNGYEDVMKAELSSISNFDDVKRYALINREHLIATFEKGESHLWLELRRKTLDGQLIWVSISFSLLQDAQHGDIYVYCIMRDINIQKRQELSLANRAKIDSLTGAYEQQTARELIDKSIQLSHSDNINFALVNFSIDKYSRIVECEGEKLAQKIMLELSRLVQYNFNDQITGRFFGNQLLVLVRGFDSHEKLISTVSDIQVSIQNSLTFSSFSSPVTISVGIVFDDTSTVDFNSTYRCAESALNSAKKSGSGQCFTYTNHIKASFMDSLFSQEQASSQAAILRCALALAETGDKTKGITTVLNEMGLFYDAQSIFVTEFSPSNDYVGGTYVWSGAVTRVTKQMKKHDIKSLCPYIFNCLEKNTISIFNDIDVLKDMYPKDYQSLHEMDVKSFFAAIVKAGNDIIGYISVVNPKRNIEDSLFFVTLHSLLSSEMEKRQLLEMRKFLSFHDSLTSLWNRHKFSEYSRLLNEESLISMGAVSVDINGLKRLNCQNGHKVGDLAVADTARVLLEVFSGYDCYRFSGDEFLAVCENISRQAFMDKILCFKNRCEEFTSFGVSVGYAWSDTDIKLGNLVRHSDEKMMSEKQEYYLKSESKTRNYDPSERTKLLEEIEKGSYVMFLQPKISAETGEVSGAEALVRYVDAQNNITCPDKFIPRYEANGLVKHIDLLIMDSACRTIRKWIDQNKNPVCISLNLSRATILVGNIVSELASIADRYSVPRHLIELEITESFGDLERETISSIGKQISTAGFRLSLDDFGAKYSNMSILSAANWDTLKIDKSLISDIFSNNNTQIILKKLFETCRELGIRAVSEGVETREQYQILISMGCNDIQGYYFNKPMPLKAFEEEYIK